MSGAKELDNKPGLEEQLLQIKTNAGKDEADQAHDFNLNSAKNDGAGSLANAHVGTPNDSEEFAPDQNPHPAKNPAIDNSLLDNDNQANATRNAVLPENPSEDEPQDGLPKESAGEVAEAAEIAFETNNVEVPQFAFVGQKTPDNLVGAGDGGLERTERQEISADLPAEENAPATDSKSDELIRSASASDDIMNDDTGDAVADGMNDVAVDENPGAGDDDNPGAGADDDLMKGGEGDDRMSGGEGDDRMSGAAGNDIMNGGAGDDRMSGGEG
ncbi:MAG: hypothetical protein AAGF25_14665, partial [Pseudomonadota bacterium]